MTWAEGGCCADCSLFAAGIDRLALVELARHSGATDQARMLSATRFQFGVREFLEPIAGRMVTDVSDVVCSYTRALATIANSA